MVDRVDFMAFEDEEMQDAKLEAYEDKAWKSGTYHLSAPCIYTKAMEALKVEPKLSFLNIGEYLQPTMSTNASQLVPHADSCQVNSL